MYDHTDTDRRYAMLTEDDRRYLLGDASGFNADEKYERHVSIRERTRHSLVDFRLLANQAPADWRNEIFDAAAFTEEYNDLDTDIAKAIEFLYVGLKGQARFRRPLSGGVARGEVELGNVEYPGQALPRFVVHSGELSHNEREVVELVRSGEWYRLESPDLFTFVRTAYQADSIDFETVEDSIDRYEDFDTREDLLHADDSIEFGKELLQEWRKSWELLQEHGEEFSEYLEHREEFQEWRDEQSD